MSKGTANSGKESLKGGVPLRKGEMPHKGEKGCDGCGGKKKGK